MVRRIFSPLLVLLALPIVASAQSAPDVIFSVYWYDAGSTPEGSQSPASSWSDSWGDSSAGLTSSVTVGGSVSGNSITLDSSTSIAGTSTGTSAFGDYGEQKFTVWVKGKRTVYLDSSNTAEGHINASGTTGEATTSFGPMLWSSSDFTVFRADGASGNVSDSDSTNDQRVVNIGCSGQNTEDSTTFPAYPGVVYYAPANMHLRFAGSSAAVIEDTGTRTIDLLADGSSTISVSFGDAEPTVALQGPIVGGVPVAEPSTGDSVTVNNLSYDSDNENGTTALEGICSSVWTLTKPDGSTSNPTGTGSISFTVGIPGTYRVDLQVTDNDGDINSDHITFTVQPRTPSPGDTPANGVDIPIECPKTGATGGNNSNNVPRVKTSVGGGSGNFKVTFGDPVTTRGYPLRSDITINSQTRFSSRTTVMGNADFTYGLHVRQESIVVNGSNETHFFVIDANGTELDYGITSSAPSAAPGVHATLSQITGGYTLTGAGKPGEVWKAGNYSYEFNSSGKLIELTDPSGNVQEVTYDGSGYPIAVTDLSTDRSIEYEYDTPGYIARIVEGGGVTTINLTYSSGKLTEIKVTDATPTVLLEVDFAYSSGRLSQIVRDGDSDSTINITYQDSGNGVMLANATWSGGGTNINYFGAVGNSGKYRASRTNAQSGVIHYDFNAAGDLIAITMPAHNGSGTAPVHTFGYDSAHHLTQWSNGSTTVDFTVNSLGLVTEVDNNAGGVWTYTYSGADLTGISDSVGTVLDIDYNDTGNPHSPTDFTDGNGNTWTYAYNSYGQVTSITPPATSPQDPITFTYEENTSSPNYGYLKQVVNGEGDTVDLSDYTPLGDVGAISTYPNGSTTNTVEFAYDAVRRLTEITNPDATTVQFAYTGRDLTSVTDESGNLTEFEWCAVCGKLTGVEMELSKVLAWTHTGDHQDATFVDARSKTTTYAYGDAGELETATYPDSSVVEYKYDSRGRFDKLVNPRGGVSDLTYNSAGRVSAVAFTNPTQTGMSFTYNADGSIATATDEAGTTTYTYTDSRQVATVEYDYSAGGLSNVQKLTYTYNDDDSVATMEWKNGTTVVADWDYTYDEAGRLIEVTNSFSQSVEYAYDGEGKITVQTNGNGTTTEYTYNQERGWPTRIDHKLSGTSFARYDLTYDGGSDTVGNITGVTELSGDTMAYTYDDLYRLTGETRTGSNSYTKTYGYDLAGNHTTLNGSTFATYDDANKFATISSGSKTYDTSGNLLTVSGPGIGSGTYTWETREKLRTQKYTGTTTYTYSYDWTGKRVARHSTGGGGSKFWYIFSGDQLVGEIGGDYPGGPFSATVAYTWGADGLAAKRWLTSSVSHYYHYGPQGETRQITDGSGTIKNTYLYSAYGLAIASTGSDYNRHRFGGKVGYFTDGPTTSPLIVAKYRWYNPEIRRWMSRDPIEYGGGDNLYDYVQGNPVTWLDPDGLARKPGKTPPSSWPTPPPNVVGDKVRWNPEGFWEGKQNVVWDPRGHGSGVDRGEGVQDGHWDQDDPQRKLKTKKRWDREGNQLPYTICEHPTPNEAIEDLARRGGPFKDPFFVPFPLPSWMPKFPVPVLPRN